MKKASKAKLSTIKGFSLTATKNSEGETSKTAILITKTTTIRVKTLNI